MTIFSMMFDSYHHWKHNLFKWHLLKCPIMIRDSLLIHSNNSWFQKKYMSIITKDFYLMLAMWPSHISFIFISNQWSSRNIFLNIYSTKQIFLEKYSFFSACQIDSRHTGEFLIKWMLYLPFRWQVSVVCCLLVLFIVT